MRALFVSDCHLSPNQPDTIDCFKQFLQGEARRADAVYILGDLFEYWIGDDMPDCEPAYDAVCTELKTLSEHTPVACMRGNRDFLLGAQFEQRSGCRILPDIYKTRIDDMEVLLMHGDLLCTDDTGYQIYRRIVQNKLVMRLFLCLSMARRQSIARYLRNKSSVAVQNKSFEIMDVNADAVTKTLRKYHDVQLLIHGHTHRQGEHQVQLDNLPTATRVVLGAWHPYGEQTEIGNAFVIDNNARSWLNF